MRIKVLLKTEKLPLLYRHRIVSLIKEGLKKSDNNYKDTFYKENLPRPFTFNLTIPEKRTSKIETIQIDKNFSIEDTVFYFPDEELSLFLSSSDYAFIMNLFNGLMTLKTFNFSSDEDMLVNSEKINITIKKVIPLNEKTINSNEVVFRTNAPIVVENGKDIPVLTDSESYNESLNVLQNIILKTLRRGAGLKQPLEFTPVKMEKQVIKHTIKEFREKTGKPVMYLTASKGIFKLKGHPEDLDFLYKTGIGNRTSQGFGMIEVIG